MATELSFNSEDIEFFRKSASSIKADIDEFTRIADNYLYSDYSGYITEAKKYLGGVENLIAGKPLENDELERLVNFADLRKAASNSLNARVLDLGRASKEQNYFGFDNIGALDAEVHKMGSVMQGIINIADIVSHKIAKALPKAKASDPLFVKKLLDDPMVERRERIHGDKDNKGMQR